MAIKSIIDLNKDLRTTLNNVPALIDTLERGFAGVNEEISTGLEAKKAVDSFETLNGGLLSECKVKLTPVQSGSGDPSPTNIRPIAGHTQVEIDVSDGQTTQEQITVNLGGTYYSGTLDVVSGELTVDKGYIEYDGSSDENWNRHAYSTDTVNAYYISANLGQKDVADGQNGQFNQIRLGTISQSSADGNAVGFVGKNTVQLRFDTAKSANELMTYFAENPLQVVYELAAPLTVQLSPTMVKALTGDNTVTAPTDGQEIEEVEYKEIFTFEDVEKAIESAVSSVYPATPSEDGTYVLTLVKSGSTITRSWVSTSEAAEE